MVNYTDLMADINIMLRQHSTTLNVDRESITEVLDSLDKETNLPAILFWTEFKDPMSPLHINVINVDINFSVIVGSEKNSLAIHECFVIIKKLIAIIAVKYPAWKPKETPISITQIPDSGLPVVTMSYKTMIEIG